MSSVNEPNSAESTDEALLQAAQQLNVHTKSDKPNPRPSISEQTKPDYISKLPVDVMDLICQHLPSCVDLMFVNRKWFLVAVKHVYRSPDLKSSNFGQFVTALTEDKQLGKLVRVLDLVNIAQIGKNSMLSRILHRCASNLKLFIAPQSHFGYAPMTSLSHCAYIEALDLSLVSEKVDLGKLFEIISKFAYLKILYFPRSSLSCDVDANMAWPPNLRRLGLSGGFPQHFIESTMFPKTLTDLQITNCPNMTSESFLTLLTTTGPQLKKLAVLYPNRMLGEHALDFVFMLCPHLRTLKISVDYMTNAALDMERIPIGHPLISLSLVSSGLMGHSDKIRPGDVLIATDYFKNLRMLFTSLLLGWNPESSSLMGLVEVLNSRGGGVWTA